MARPGEAELLLRWEREAREAREEAMRLSEEEAKLELEIRDRRSKADGARARVPESNKDADVAGARSREALGKARAAREQCLEYDDFLAALEKERGIVADKVARIRKRLGGTVTGELEEAERTLRKREESIEKAGEGRQEASKAAERLETRARELKEEADSKRAIAEATEEEADRLAKEFQQKRERLVELRSESRTAMAQAWAKKMVYDGFVSRS